MATACLRGTVEHDETCVLAAGLLASSVVLADSSNAVKLAAVRQKLPKPFVSDDGLLIYTLGHILPKTDVTYQAAKGHQDAWKFVWGRVSAAAQGA